jgi:hypothetical protein
VALTFSVPWITTVVGLHHLGPVVFELGSRALITRAYNAPIYLLGFVAIEEARGRIMLWLSDGQTAVLRSRNI